MTLTIVDNRGRTSVTYFFFSNKERLKDRCKKDTLKAHNKKREGDVDVQVNLLAVVLAMVSSMVVGMIWYARPVFGNIWIKLARVDMKKNSSAVMPIVITAIMSLITAYILACVAFLCQHFYGNGFMEASLMSAFWMWLAFAAARMVTHDVFEGRPAALTLLNLAHELVTFMVMGLIIGFMGV